LGSGSEGDRRPKVICLLACAMLLAWPACGAAAPVVYPLDDFDDGNLQNDGFGPSGKWEDGGSAVRETFPAPGSDGMGRRLRLEWRLVPGTAGAGWWMRPAPRGTRDMREFAALRLSVRGEGFSEGEALRLKLADRTQAVEIDLAAPTTEWSLVEAPFDRFAGVDLSAVQEVALALSPGDEPTEGALEVDELQLVSRESAPADDEALLELIGRRTFRYFVECADAETGLVADAASNLRRSSIAAVGCSLAAMPIGIERGWIGAEDGEAHVLRALRTLHGRAAYAGFYHHFLDGATGGPWPEPGNEISTIDTAILVTGALRAREHFGPDSAIGRLAEELYEGVDWPAALDPERRRFYHILPPPAAGARASTWDYYTDETLLICRLAVESPTHPVSADVTSAWRQEVGEYGDSGPVVQSWFGSLFTYFIASLWVDTQGLHDPITGVDWWENARRAALANRQFCLDHASEYETYSRGWGLTACLGPRGYGGDFGALPAGAGRADHDGTVAPCAAAMSLPVFRDPDAPNYALDALHGYFGTKLWGLYGFRDGFNLGPAAGGPADDWYAHDYIGLNQGLTLLGLRNPGT